MRSTCAAHAATLTLLYVLYYCFTNALHVLDRHSCNGCGGSQSVKGRFDKRFNEMKVWREKWAALDKIDEEAARTKAKADGVPTPKIRRRMDHPDPFGLVSDPEDWDWTKPLSAWPAYRKPVAECEPFVWND